MASQLRYRVGEKARLELAIGDIVEETTDAIVNAANSSLLGGGGVDGAIHHAAGPQLLVECRKIREQRGPLPPGEAVSTLGGNLKARYVIHTVGPVWQGGSQNEPELLANCYRNSLQEANRLNCASMSFPSISTGAFRYPVPEAADIALRTLAGLLHSPASLLLARFVLFDRETYSAYARAASYVSSVFPHFQVRAEAIP